ncbi:MAG TPA: UDP-glucose/GDP-mannose dehydrogenase family protein [Candidatus Dormibacteraeota bacterium]|nr:UDP-glucose/GDP-mannose dehydrogenase family protein [Candidatus Dormibacteraeota bacterium]
MDRTIAIAGAGYVGLVTGACLASADRRVVMVEVDPERRQTLAEGRVPIYEPGLEPVLRAALEAGHLRVTDDWEEALAEATMVVVAVGTPPRADGRADLTAVEGVIATVRAHARPGTVLVMKSTVPPGTSARLQQQLRGEPFSIPIVSCPEFLREGAALEDVRKATRVVVGGTDREACERVADVMGVPGAEVVRTDNTSAELIKYGSNSFLALKISFINEIANVCDLMGGDVDAVAHGMGLDPRIGRAFLNAGLGFGGSCFPKDVRALDQAAGRYGYSFWMLKTAIEVNDQQRMRFVSKIRAAVDGPLEGKRIAILGLAFKPGTDDMRQACSIDVALRLMELGAEVVAHDPVAMEKAAPHLPGVELADSAYEAVDGADCVALVTEWPEYLRLNWNRVRHLVKRPLVVDGRNCLDRDEMAACGFTYHGMGRQPGVVLWGRRATDRVRLESEGVA